MLQTITQYYFVDWFAMVGTFSWIYFTGEKKRFAFFFGIFGCLMWLVLGFMISSWGSIITNFMCVILNVQAYLKWGAQE